MSLPISTNISSGIADFAAGTGTATHQITNANVTYTGDRSVTLLPGFKAEATVFTAQISTGYP